MVAAAIGVPDNILIGACKLPGHLMATCRLLGADRRPATKLTGYHVDAASFERGSGPGAMLSRKNLLPTATRLVERADPMTVPGTPIARPRRTGGDSAVPISNYQ